jgi:hypothetical protein
MTKPRKLAALIAILVLSTAAPVLRADSFGFTYTTASGTVIAGNLSGTLQPDANTILVSGLLSSLTVDGVSYFTPVFTGSYAAFWSLPGGPFVPTVTLDGTHMDLLACGDLTCSGATPYALIFQSTAFSSTLASFRDVSPGGTETFNPQNWSIAPVPEPSTMWMFAIGAAAILLNRNRLRWR